MDTPSFSHRAQSDILDVNSWKETSSAWALDVILNHVAALSPGSDSPEQSARLILQGMPGCSILGFAVFGVDPGGEVLRRGVMDADSRLLAWFIECAWGQGSADDGLLSGSSIVRFRGDGLLVDLCIPLVSMGGVRSVVACTISGSSRAEVAECASRLTLLSSLSSGSTCHADEATSLRRGITKSKALGLTVRQRTIVTYMAQGMTNRQIAARVKFSESTVRLESMAIYRFYGVHSRTEAVAAARAAGHLQDELLPVQA
jgi:DNA-binding CsgD family transcriptional regulator